MNMRAFACLGLVALAGCTTTKYEWGAYPNALLDYYRDATERAAFDEALTKAIAKGEGSHRVPPGLFAEAGYEALQRGDKAQAIAYFNREKSAWPESAVYMDKAIAGAGKPVPAAAANPTPSS